METQATRIFNMRMTWFSFLFVSIVLCFETTFPHTSTGLSNTRFWWLTVIETMSTAPTTLRPKHMVQEMFRQSTHLFWFIVFIDRKDVLKLQNPWNYLQHAAFWKISFQSFGSAGWCFFWQGQLTTASKQSNKQKRNEIGTKSSLGRACQECNVQIHRLRCVFLDDLFWVVLRWFYSWNPWHWSIGFWVMKSWAALECSWYGIDECLDGNVLHQLLSGVNSWHHKRWKYCKVPWDV